MDIFQALRDFISGGTQKKKIEQPVQQQARTITPGYEDAARRYEDAFKRGDYNSPDIIGKDPKYFGYPEDVAPSTLSIGTPNRQSIQGGALDLQGRSNPGFIPFQNSGFGGQGYTSNNQPASGIQSGYLAELLKRKY